MMIVLSKESIDAVKSSNGIPSLTTYKAWKPIVRAHLRKLKELIESSNSTGAVSEGLPELCLKILNNNEMYYAEASKVEVIMVLAKFYQLKGHSFDDCFMGLCNEYFNYIPIV